LTNSFKMPPKRPQAPPSLSDSNRPSRGQLRAPLEQSLPHASKKKRVDKSKNSVEIIDDEDEEPEEIERPRKSKQRAVITVVGEYLLNAKTLVGAQVVHRDCSSMVEGLFSYRRYSENSDLKVESYANTHSITPILVSSTAVVHSKGMKKPEEHLSIDVHQALDWIKVDSIVHHLAKSLSKGITVDFVVKYKIRRDKNQKDDVDEDVLESDSSKEDGNPAPQPEVKRLRRVFTRFSAFDI